MTLIPLIDERVSVDETSYRGRRRRSRRSSRRRRSPGSRGSPRQPRRSSSRRRRGSRRRTRRSPRRYRADSSTAAETTPVATSAPHANSTSPFTDVKLDVGDMTTVINILSSTTDEGFYGYRRLGDNLHTHQRLIQYYMDRPADGQLLFKKDVLNHVINMRQIAPDESVMNLENLNNTISGHAKILLTLCGKAFAHFQKLGPNNDLVVAHILHIIGNGLAIYMRQLGINDEQIRALLGDLKNKTERLRQLEILLASIPGMEILDVKHNLAAYGVNLTDYVHADGDDVEGLRSDLEVYVHLEIGNEIAGLP